MAKQINPSHPTEKKGLLKIQEVVNKLNWIFRPTPNDDYGIDGEIEPVVNSAPTNRLLKVQSKSGQSYITRATDQCFSFVASQDDLDYWSCCNVPVILVIHDPSCDRSYWKWIQQYLQDNPGAAKSRRLEFSRTSDLFEPHAGETLLKIAADTSTIADVEKPPQPPHQECLLSNLLKVTELPRYIFSVSTNCSSPAEVRYLLADKKKPPFILREKRLYTFSNIMVPDHPLMAAASANDIRQQDRQTWESDQDKILWLVNLMNVTLRKKLVRLGLAFDKDRSRYHFEPRDGKEVRIWYHALTRRITRKVAYKYPEIDPKFWVHHGARFRFMKLGIHWFLMIEPIYVFTQDGKNLLAAERVGKLSTKRKAKEYNQTVLNHLVFWKEILSEGQLVIRIYPAVGDQAFTTSKIFADGLAEFGVPGDTRDFRQLEEATEFQVVLEGEERHEEEEFAEEEPQDQDF